MMRSTEASQTSVIESYPLAAVQRSLLSGIEATHSSGANIEQVIGTLHEKLNAATFERAWQLVVERHAILRTRLVRNAEGVRIQEVLRDAPIRLEQIDWRETSAHEQDTRWRVWLKADRQRGFNLADAPLMRIMLFQLAAVEYRLVWTFPHVLLDARSFALVLKEVFRAYELLRDGREPNFPEPRPYREFVEWDAKQDFSASRMFWREWLDGLEEPTRVELPRPDGTSGREESHREVVLSLPKDATVRAKARAEEIGVTLNTFVEASWALLLSFYSGKEDLVFGAVRAGRHGTVDAAESCVGLFINTLPLRVRIEADKTVAEWLRSVRERQLAMRPHEHTPLETILASSSIAGGAALFESVVSFQNPAWHEALRDQGGAWARREFRVINQPTVPLWLDTFAGAEWVLKIGYDRSKFEDAAIERLANHLRNILEALVQKPDQRVAEISPLTPAEREQMLVHWNNTAGDLPTDKLVHELFEAHAAKGPNAPAIVADQRHLTYAELDQATSEFAARLQAAGVRGKVVGICLERSPELVIAALAILKAGAAYAPLDPSYPAERIGHIIADAQMPLVLTRDEWRERIPSSAARVASFDSLDADLPGARPFTHEGITLDDLAYVIYTSGSTGEPKGVAITHRSLLNLIHWHQREYSVTAADRATLIASPAFDASVWETWPYLVAGASLHIPDEVTRLSATKLADWLQTQQITVAFVPTPMAEEMFEVPWVAAPALRVLLTGGDKLHRPPPLNFPCRVVNHYGPTECTVVATSAIVECAEVAHRPPPIGRPIANTRVYVLDAQLRPVPVGVPGELHIGGAGVARGYLNRPELTEAKFVRDPFTPDTEARLYRTGDLVRWRADGQLEFIGRKDQQVKIRGHRIELGEIESQLLRHPDVKEAVVVAKAAAEQLLAFVVPRGKQDGLAGTLRQFLKERLPHFMLPAFVFVDALPMTPNGKVDRRELAARHYEPEGEAEIVLPRNRVEQAIAEIWTDVLGRKRVGIHDNFFDLGGHSLAGARVMTRLSQISERELGLHELFDAPTIARLAQRVRLKENGDDAVRLSTARIPSGRLSFAQERLWFLEQLSPNVPFNNIPIAFELRGAVDADALERALNKIIRRHPVFQTAFSQQGGQPRAVREPAGLFALQQHDFSSFTPAEAAEKAARLIAEQAAVPFDLARPPLLRATLIKLGTEEFRLLIVTHHIVCDGWSTDILHRDLATFYELFHHGQPPACIEMPGLEYAEFADEQRRVMSNGVSGQLLEYWKRQLEGIPPALELPTDRPRPPLQTYRGAWVPVELPASLTRELEALARRENVTLFMLLLAAFQTLLHRYCGQEDIVVGSPVAGRTRAGAEDVIGLFLNTVVLRGDFSDTPDFHELLNRTRRVTLDALARQELPFEMLAEAIQPNRDLSRSPLFQVMFVLQNEPLRPLELEGLAAKPLNVHSGTAKFDLTLSLQPQESALRGYFEYSADLFDEARIARMAAHFQTLLEGVVADPGRRVSELPLLTAAEREQMLVNWNATQAEFPDEHCIHELFEDQAARTPGAIAVACGDEELTYYELNERAEQVAVALREMGVGPEVCVGISLERSVEMLAGLLGILKAGGAYLPLDPTYPEERLQFMLRDSGAVVLLTDGELGDGFASALPELKCLRLDQLGSRLASNGKPHGAPRSANLAYLIYTSGSTGTPKGVMLTHRNVVNFFTAMDRVLGTDPGVWLAVTSISFDISVLELLWTVTRGFKVVIHRPESDARRVVRPARATKPLDFSLFYFGSDADERSESKYRLLIEGAKFADAQGFAAVWTPERHFHSVGGLYPNPSVTSAALAMITSRLQIRAGSVVLPLHQPLRVAEEWAVVDQLSRGRAAISFASGWHANDFALAPEKFSRRKDVVIAGVQTLRRLWRGEAVPATSGSGAAIEARVFPRPVQREIPLWLTSSGNVDTFRTAGELGLNLLTHLFGQGIEDLARKIAVYRDAWRQAGHTGEGKISVMLHTFVAESQSAAWEQVRGPLRNYLRTYREFSRQANPVNGGRARAEADSDVDLLLDRAVEGYFETGGLFGAPEDALPLVNKLRALGIDELACLIDFGIETETVLANLPHLNRLRELASVAKPAPQRSRSPGLSIPEEIARHQVTHLQCTPSLAQALITSPEGVDALKSLKTLLLGGEALPVPLARELRSLMTGEFVNMYGPTETTIWSTTHRIEGIGDVMPIGRPIANTQVYILDRNLQPVPIGTSGELFIGGEGVARGYWNRPELTAEKFVRNPFSADPNARLYRTGDRVFYRPDGTIQFLGRFDHQIKLRGHRIELGEIESALRAHPAVRECVVDVFAPSADDQRLVAYLVGAPGTDVSDGPLRRFLEAKLPGYMIPGAFVRLEELPLTPNGKINRKALPKPNVARSAPKEDFAAPLSEIEKQIAKLWEKLLRVERVGRHDNFFDLGGHSLLVVQAQARLREAFKTDVPVVRLFQYPTVAGLAEFISQGRETKSLVSARDRGRRQRAAFQQRQPSLLVA